MTTRGNPANVALGPGLLLAAIIGATEPTDLTTAWAPAWVPIGYTAEGSTASYSTSYDPVEVAEELDMIDQVATGREIKVSFSSAEMTAINFKRAMNGGTITITGTGASAIATFEPPELGEELYVALGFESEDHKERWVWRQCKQTGNVEVGRKKGADKALIPMEFSVFKPTSGLKPFKMINSRGVVTS